MKSRKKTFKIQPVGAWVNVVLTNNIAEYRQWMTDKLGFPSVGDLAQGADEFHTWYYDKYPGQNWILLESNSSLNVIAHEVNHASETIDDYFMINSREFRACLQGYLTDEIFKFVNKKK